MSVLKPLNIGRMSLANRVIMAPLTRGRADPGCIPSALMVEYYMARATAGLIITEATPIHDKAVGRVGHPGIWNDEQMNKWKAVTDGVHSKDGKIFIQLWHLGRVSHPDFLNGESPVAPSEIAAKGESHTPSGKKQFTTPRALTIPEIKEIVQQYAAAAERALKAGFDGVEIHGANGYLIDQFIKDGSNHRTDEYGGSTDNRLRFLVEVTQAVSAVIGSDRVGVRLSPTCHYNDMNDSDPVKTFTRAAELLNGMNIAYLHTLEALPGHMFASEGERVTPHIRKVFHGPLITNGGYTFDLANKALDAGEADAISFGVPFIANPDLVKRFMTGSKLNQADISTFYTPGPKGYTDYPLL